MTADVLVAVQSIYDNTAALNTVIPNFYFDEAPAGVTWPYAVYEFVVEMATDDGARGFTNNVLETTEIKITVKTATSDLSQTLKELVKDTFNKTAFTTYLTGFAGCGPIIAVRRRADSPDRNSAAKRAWIAEVTLTIMRNRMPSGGYC